MRLAGEQSSTHRPLDAHSPASRKPRAIPQQQRRALVGREAAREADHQHIGPRSGSRRPRHLTPLRPPLMALPGELTACRRARTPCQHVATLTVLGSAAQNASIRRPIERRARAPASERRSTPLGPGDLAIEELRPSLVQEGRHVHPVRDDSRPGFSLRRELRASAARKASAEDTMPCTRLTPLA
jgi:hypothetical protein